MYASQSHSSVSDTQLQDSDKGISVEVLVKAYRNINMSEVFSIFLGNFILCVANLLFVKIVSKLKIQRNTIFTFIFMLFIIFAHTVVYFLGYGMFRTALISIFYISTYKILFNIDLKSSIFLTIMYFILILIPPLLTLLISTPYFVRFIFYQMISY